MIDIEKARQALQSLSDKILCYITADVYFFTSPDGKKIVDSCKNDVNVMQSAIEELERLQKTDTTLEIVKEKRADLAKMYEVVCETEPQKAIARTVDNVLEEIIQEAEEEK